MKKIDNDKVSLVEFLSSIKFARRNTANSSAQRIGHFANFNPQARPARTSSVEDSQLIRSAN